MDRKQNGKNKNRLTLATLSPLFENNNRNNDYGDDDTLENLIFTLKKSYLFCLFDVGCRNIEKL